MDQLASPWLNCWQGQQSTLFSVSSTLPSTSAFFQCPRGRRRPSRLPPVVSTTGAVANASRTRATAWSPSAASCDAQNAMSITFVDREKYCAAIRTLLPTGPTSTHANVTAGPIHMPKLCKEGKCARVDRGADCASYCRPKGFRACYGGPTRGRALWKLVRWRVLIELSMSCRQTRGLDLWDQSLEVKVRIRRKDLLYDMPWFEKNWFSPSLGSHAFPLQASSTFSLHHWDGLAWRRGV